MRRMRWSTRAAKQLLTAVLGAAVIGSVLVGPAQSASAYTYYRHGRAGTVRILDQVQGTHYQFCFGGYWIQGVYFPNCTWSPAVVGPQLRIARSKRSGAAQSVTVTWKIQRIGEHGWYTHYQESARYRIKKGAARVTTPYWYRIPTRADTMRLVLKVKWTRVRDGRTLGSYTALMNHAADYRCATQFPCAVQKSSIWLRSPTV